MQEAAMTSTSGREDVEARVTEPRSLGRGPWAAETQTPGKGTVLGSAGISEFGEGNLGRGTQTSERMYGESCIEIGPAVLEKQQAGLRCCQERALLMLWLQVPLR